MKICYVTVEAEPFAKSGGLGDVLGALPPKIAENGDEVILIMPLYEFAKDNYKNIEFLMETEVWLGWRRQVFNVYTCSYRNVKYYFIDSSFYFGGASIYDIFDLERFSFFCKASLEILPLINFQPDIIHCNDWSTALVPVMKEYFYGRLSFYQNIKTIFTIHNLQHQGIYEMGEVIDKTGIDGNYFTPDRMEYYGRCNLMKGAIVMSDYITTVSNSYAEEILTPQYGEGLDGLLFHYKNKLSGIVNGIDYSRYNPIDDELLNTHYDEYNYNSGKQMLKEALQTKMGLPVKDVPLFGCVSRLYEQKGLDIVAECAGEISSMGGQLILLGSGERWLEEKFLKLEQQYPDNICAEIGFNNALAHEIYGASDFFLMPSRFEPCGLSQLIAMRYGTLPLVRRTGGLRDTVTQFDDKGNGTGILFDNCNEQDLLKALSDAINLYDNKLLMDKIIINAMSKDFSWNKSAEKYRRIYEEILK